MLVIMVIVVRVVVGVEMVCIDAARQDPKTHPARRAKEPTLPRSLLNGHATTFEQAAFRTT